MENVRRDVLEALRNYVESYQASVSRFARWMQLPHTDGNALGEIIWAERSDTPLSPTTLASRVSLTTGATNALINRLEHKGLVTRSREHQDRRSVTLRTTDRARVEAEPFLADAATRLGAALEDYGPAELALVRDFIDRFAAILPQSLEREG